MARGSRSAAAYRHVNISSIPVEAREEILSDADAGGKDFGLVVVEVAYNGPAQTNIYGVYAKDEDLWLSAQAEFGFEELNTDVDLTADAQAKAQADAEAAKAKEEADLAAIGKNKK
jgi:hypothetical protein